MDLQNLFSEYKFSEAEKKFIAESKTPYTSDINQSRIVSEFILGKRIEDATNKIIESNKKLAASNEKYAKRMLWLTGALVFVGLVQIFCN